MKPLNILSLGAGWQSTILYYMSSTGELPIRFDYAIFEDTGREYKGTYQYMRFLERWQKENNGIPIVWSGLRSIYRDLKNAENATGQRFVTLPLYTKNPDGSIGQLQRQCTNEYKIEQVTKDVRKLQGLKPKQRNKPVNMFIGLTVDEIRRVSKPHTKQWINLYPLTGGVWVDGSGKSGIDTAYHQFKMHTVDCPKWYKNYDLPLPPRSRCTMCPFQTDDMWKDLRDNDPKEWKVVVKLDRELRLKSGGSNNRNPVYFHRSCVPLDEVKFIENQSSLDFFDCSGTCNT